MHGGAVKFELVNLKGRDHLGELGMNGRTMDFKEMGLDWIDLAWCRIQ
jgi:hypothetical protein